MRALYLLFPAAALTALFLAGPGFAHERGRGERREHDSRDGEPGDGERRGSRAAGPLLSTPAGALYAKECGSCHLAYPPGFLPAESWRKTMAGLERHFGQNAELDAETAAALERWLVDSAAEAGTSKRSRKVLIALDGAAPLRLSDTPYFQRKHRELDARVLTRPSIRSWANCGACHGGAREWDFSDDRVKIPAR